MNGVLSFIVGVIWGSLSAQFLVQVVTSVAVTLVYLAAIISRKVSRNMNFAGALTGFFQSIMYAIFCGGGNWLTSEYVIDYATWNAASIASLFAFVGTIIYVAPQVPGRIVLAKMCGFVPNFMEASMRVPAVQRVAFARKWRSESQR